ncbi:MAG: c-type cytochrome biogenesis protein CcsB [Hydrogenophilales bacterium 16-64-46]|nr:MAG: c-type cytochrome biogenesis protein CcsB [Hydrogenophilales bacterium 12-64-13]OYZ06582.1 MAG: c-type cytochrome biogenesis protein CcsB [Hydrogenophilales bacterium 16-64-46]OZA39290.1 MAG: c-type cytochrome biogenesis protein CcsB [Hydrogenophilales bacterium 17-64-34]HQS98846.1 c-type cytochrome biogenesis protein CcsB [Thiobacillus sp.]
MEIALNQPAPLFKRLTWFDWLFAAIVAGGLLFALSRYGEFMDIYEKAILLAAIPSLAAFGWFWKPFRVLFIAVGALSLVAIGQYDGDLGRMEQAFLLKYLISSQAAIMWMCALFLLATVTYWAGLLARSDFLNRTGTAMVWVAVTLGFVGLMVRWYESYLIGPDVGHIPVSNLYEVFVLFCLITSMMYLYYEARYQARQLGGFVLIIISAAVGFILWYTFDRGAHEIQPLVPALKSWWMKLHVPANFVGYGAFSIAAMLGVAYLLSARGILASRLPKPEVIDDIMYKAIAIGFAFFTIATILGAMWAAEAWGGYWSWDPKETWALIVWLNYAAWLHIRLVKGLRGPMLAWWAVVGLFVTTFAFIGVNMFLSGLHSYGEL